MMESFLTSHNPSYLPGGCVDPLGFEREYFFFPAHQLLPGLTNEVSRGTSRSSVLASASAVPRMARLAMSRQPARVHFAHLP